MDEVQEEIEVLDLDTVAEEQDASVTGASEVEELRRKLEESETKNREMFARLKKQQAKSQSTQSATDEDWKGKVDFVISQGRELESDEVEEVVAYAKGKGISYAEAMKSPVISTFLKENKAQKRVSSATPGSSKSSFSSNGKSWEQMNPSERSQNYQAFLQSRLRK